MGVVGSTEELLGRRRIWAPHPGGSRRSPSLRRFSRPFSLSLPAARAHQSVAFLAARGFPGERPGRRTGVRRPGSSRRRFSLHPSLHPSTRLFLLSPRAHSRPFTVLSLRYIRTAPCPLTPAMVFLSPPTSSRGKRSARRST